MIVNDYVSTILALKNKGYGLKIFFNKILIKSMRYLGTILIRLIISYVRSPKR